MVRRPVDLRFGDWTELLRFCTEQISRGGLSVPLRDPPSVGDPVRVRIIAPDSSEVALLGKVLRMAPPDSGGGSPRVGIHLFKPTAETLEQLVALVHRARERATSTEDGLAAEPRPLASPPQAEDLPRAEPTPGPAPTPAPVPVPPRMPPPSPPPEPRRRVRQYDARAASTRGAPFAAGREAPVVGIDFGTAYSKVAVVDRGEVVLIEDLGHETGTPAAVPSIVAYRPGGTIVVGHGAREIRATDPSCVISSVKRLMGLRYHDPLADGVLGSLACRTVAGPNDAILFDMHGQMITVASVVARVLEHLKAMASQWLGGEVRRAVFTTPVEFNERARRELQMAARMAGLEVMSMIPEPVAAAMGCGHGGSGEALVAVYDFGGGTFDASIVQVGADRFNVLGAAGDRWLGGDDLDEAIAEFAAGEFYKATGIKVQGKAVEWQRLVHASEEAKRWLSTLHIVNVILPHAGRTAEGWKTLFVPVTRARFEELAADVIGSSLVVCSQALAKEGLSPEQVEQVLVTGGTTRVPAVQDAVRRFYGREPTFGVHPEHAVVIGAAVHAAALSGEPLPADSIERLRSQGGVGHTIGLALAGGHTEHIIDRSQRPPVAAYKLYSTSRDNQSACRIEIVEGDSKRTDENRQIGGFVIDGLPPAPAGEVDLEVYFELGSTGTLFVTAQERSTGRRVRHTFDLKKA